MRDIIPAIDTAAIGRRQLLKTGAAASSALAMPYFFSRRASARQNGPLQFWQFYSPGGDVQSQDQWFQDTVKAWNDANEIQVEDYPALYAPFLLPRWNDGPEVSFTMSQFGPYEVYLMQTSLLGIQPPAATPIATPQWLGFIWSKEFGPGGCF